jgi:hypothetical protein
MKLRNCRKEEGFYHESILKIKIAPNSWKNSSKSVFRAKDKNNSTPKKITQKKCSNKKKSKKVTSKTKAISLQEFYSDLEDFKTNFQYEIIKSLSSAGLSTKRGSFEISFETARELRRTYEINCRFTSENSAK